MENEREFTESESQQESWIKQYVSFCETISDFGKSFVKSDDEKNCVDSVDGFGLQDSMESVLKSMAAFNSMAADRTGSVPEAFLETVRSAWKGFDHLHREFKKASCKFGQSSADFSIDQESFRLAARIYESRFRQFFNIPQLGLTRVYQEHLNLAADRFAIFQASIGEFLSMLFLPMENTAKLMQKKLSEMLDKGIVPENSKEFYRLWISILETNYMNLFKSPEYVDSLRKTLDSIGEFMIARKQMLEDALQTIPVPTQKEMDELYKEIYLLKKKIKQLENRIPRCENLKN